MQMYQIALLVAAGIILVLYLRRRRSRLDREK